MGKETWRRRKALSSNPSSAWSLVTYLTSLGLQMLSHITVAFPQKMKRECVECPSHGTWPAVRAQQYQLPLSVQVSPSRRWQALIKWLGSVDTHQSCAPSDSLSASTIQQTLRSLWNQPEEGRSLGGKKCAHWLLWAVIWMRKFQLWKHWNFRIYLFSPARRILNNLCPFSTDHTPLLCKPKCLAPCPPSGPQTSANEAVGQIPSGHQ